MAIRIEKGGWALMFLLGLGVVGYTSYRYGLFERDTWQGLGAASLRQTSGVDTSRPLGSGAESDEVRVRVYSWVGAAPGLVANSGLTTAPGSIYHDKRLRVTFRVIDDWAEAQEAFARGEVDVALTSVDRWARDSAELQKRNAGGHAFLLVDWSRGADGVIAREGIRTVEDLAGKRVAFAPHTASHFLLWAGLRNSAMGSRQRSELLAKAVHTDSAIEAAGLFIRRQVDAAVGWEPDLTNALSKVPGAAKVYDTSAASKLVAHVLIVRDDYAARNPRTVVRLAEGWIEAVDLIAKQPQRAAAVIGTVKELNTPADRAGEMLEGVRLADRADNAAFFRSAESEYANVFRMAQEMYREERLLGSVADPETTVDRRYLAELKGVTTSYIPIRYSAPPADAAPFLSPRRFVYFEPDRNAMPADAKAVVDEIAGFLRAFENSVADVEAHGGRPDAIKAHLVSRGLAAERLRAVAGKANGDWVNVRVYRNQ